MDLHYNENISDTVPEKNNTMYFHSILVYPITDISLYNKIDSQKHLPLINKYSNPPLGGTSKDICSPDNFCKFLRDALKLDYMVYITSCIYLYRFRIRKNTDIKLDRNNIYNLISVSLLIAIKTINDEAFDINARLSIATRLPLRHLNRLETYFLNDISFDTHVSRKEFYYMCMIMMKQETYSEVIWDKNIEKIIKRSPYI